jgi:hypothetical protein
MQLCEAAAAEAEDVCPRSLPQPERIAMVMKNRMKEAVKCVFMHEPPLMYCSPYTINKKHYLI